MRRSRTGPYCWSLGSEAAPTSLSPGTSVATATRGGQRGSAAAHRDEIPMRAGSVSLGENHADVVLAPVSIGAPDQCFTCCLDVPAPLENQLRQVVIVHHIGQPVRAEQQRVPALPGDAVQLGNSVS